VVKNNNTPNSEEREYLVSELQDRINDIDSILISKNDKSITLNKDSDTWQVQEAGDFLADANKVANVLLDLRKFRLKQKKTNNPENYEKLSLADSGTNAATHIILKSKGAQIADIFIGKQAKNSQGTYVRINSETQTWLSGGEINLNLEPKDWIVASILDVDSSEVKSVTFQPMDSDAFSISKITPDDKIFILENIADTKQLKASVKLDSLANGLQKLSIQTAFAKSDINNESVVTSVIYQLFSGLTYQLDLYKKEDKLMMNIDVKNAQANEASLKLTNWVYEIPSYKFDALNKRLSDLLEDKAVDEKESPK
jgi:hypothetical protein